MVQYDANGEPIISTLNQDSLVVKTSYQFRADGELRSCNPALDIVLADEYLNPDQPNTSPLMVAHETMPFKQHAELIITGTAHPNTHQPHWTDVSAELVTLDGAQWKKSLRIHAPRETVDGKLQYTKPMEATSITYQQAQGFAQNDDGFSANPAGLFIEPEHLEQPPKDQTIAWFTQEYTEASTAEPLPAGFGALAPFWLPRVMRPDLDASKHNVAPDDQQLSHTFNGGERLTMSGFFDSAIYPTASLTCALPGPLVSAQLINTEGQPTPLDLIGDTLIVDTDAATISHLWRAQVPHPVDDTAPMWVTVQALDA